MQRHHFFGEAIVVINAAEVQFADSSDLVAPLSLAMVLARHTLPS
jgi:hypothetical protein